jgi:hypothetical protein
MLPFDRNRVHCSPACIWLHNQVACSDAVAALSVLALVISLISRALDQHSTLAIVLLWLAETLETLSLRVPQASRAKLGNFRLQGPQILLGRAIFAAFSGYDPKEKKEKTPSRCTDLPVDQTVKAPKTGNTIEKYHMGIQQTEKLKLSNILGSRPHTKYCCGC